MIGELDQSLATFLTETIEPGTSVLVSGPVHAGQFDLCVDLLTAKATNATGSVVITADQRVDRLVSELELLEGDTGRRYRIIDARSGQSSGPSAEEGVVATVNSPADLTGIGIELLRSLEELRTLGVGEARLGIDSISTLTQYLDPTVVFKFLHTVVGRCEASGITCIGTLNTPIHDEQELSLFASLFDVHVEIRDGDEGFEVRVLGLDTGPTNWHPLK